MLDAGPAVHSHGVESCLCSSDQPLPKGVSGHYCGRFCANGMSSV